MNDGSEAAIRDLRRTLDRALSGELPGAAAHRLMAPRPRPGWAPEALPEAARPGAALVLLYGRAGTPHLLLTVRRGDLGRHAGQVALPGGAVDSGEGVEAAALREAQEEVGLEPHDVDVLGRLSSLHIPVSGFVLHPVVAISPPLAGLRPQEAEVERILEVPLDELGRADRVRAEIREIRGHPVEVPFFDVGGETVWGATAMVLAELLWLLGKPPRPPRA